MQLANQLALGPITALQSTSGYVEEKSSGNHHSSCVSFGNRWAPIDGSKQGVLASSNRFNDIKWFVSRS